MHPIYISATFTFTLALLAFGALLWQFTPRIYRRYIFAVWAIGLAMSPGAFYLVRVPLLVRPLTPWLEAQTAQGGSRLVAADVVRLTFAPLTEEPVKLLPWLAALAIGWPLVPAKKLVV